MSPRLRHIAVFAFVVLALAGWWFYRSRPEARILRRLDALAAALGKDGAESQLLAAATAREVGGFFAPGFVVRAQPYEGSLSDPQQLMGAVMRFRAAGERIAVTFGNRDVELAAGAPTAIVTFVATVTLDRGSGPSRESWRVRSLWVEDPDEWRISELELVERVEDGGLLNVF